MVLIFGTKLNESVKAWASVQALMVSVQEFMVSVQDPKVSVQDLKPLRAKPRVHIMRLPTLYGRCNRMTSVDGSRSAVQDLMASVQDPMFSMQDSMVSVQDLIATMFVWKALLKITLGATSKVSGKLLASVQDSFVFVQEIMALLQDPMAAMQDSRPVRVKRWFPPARF